MSRTSDAAQEGPSRSLDEPESAADEVLTREQRRQRIRDALEKLAAMGAFADIDDPVEWQREIRKDRPLPGRDP